MSNSRFILVPILTVKFLLKASGIPFPLLLSYSCIILVENGSCHYCRILALGMSNTVSVLSVKFLLYPCGIPFPFLLSNSCLRRLEYHSCPYCQIPALALWNTVPFLTVKFLLYPYGIPVLFWLSILNLDISNTVPVHIVKFNYRNVFIVQCMSLVLESRIRNAQNKNKNKQTNKQTKIK